MRALLDTHALLWWILDASVLPLTTRSMIEDGGNMMLVSAASAWEIAIKFQLGRLPRAAGLVSNFGNEVKQEGFESLEISAEHGIRAGLLPRLHKDPFDRMLIAQSQSENIPVISNDTVFDTYGVRRLW